MALLYTLSRRGDVKVLYRKDLLSLILSEYPTIKVYNSYYAQGFLVKYDKMNFQRVPWKIMG